MADPAPPQPSPSLRRRLLDTLRSPAEPYSSEGHCLVIAEVAQAHDGSLGTAHAYVDAVADASADAVKFQTHIAAAESTREEPWRVRFSPQDETRYDYWRRMEFTPEQWRGLAEHAAERGLVFLSSPFSLEAVDLLEGLDVPAWKIASGEVLNEPLVDRMLATGKPVLLSTGLATLEELDGVAARIRERLGDDPSSLAVLQCTTAYPCPPERVGLEQMEVFRERWGCSVGLSDHSGTIFPGIAAATLGAEVLEVHVTFHRKSFGPDVPASVTVDELTELVRGVRFVEAMRASPVDKTALSEETEGLRRTFGRKVVAARDLEAGTVLGDDDLALKKPGDGLPPSALAGMLGRRLVRDVARDEALAEGDVEVER